ncbi:hypothetical protein MITS9509_02658 [Synechococcus sp. MIT S9509]|uniref:2OG-Fe(II) oxygenase n=1 Tax=unclassified Synechococcus TaxID=2626047 RepID=UPI0007BAEDE1|nr:MULTISPECIES: 2OG-Fe(II) oxygenase [unclassified Synechococcus]KZR84409.1 hypothetical protein MITS9504_02943 [Synechococcus sp. MIT S9504]KZR90761.1 hypothetical protein MITS9509_02658 [Synechococcus sp. MIT S9509]
MLRLNSPVKNECPNFIGSWAIEPQSVCDELIAYFEVNKRKQKQGVTAGGKNLKTKNTIDVHVSPKELLLPENKCFRNYFTALFECYADYTEQWPFLKEFVEELHIGGFNIQRYEEGQHFQKVHTERSSVSNLHRLFAWMTYLNDVAVQDGGSTIFTHYGLEFQPKKGQTLIWPAEWTHAHKGSLLTGNSKYIITGWMHFAS